MARKVRCHELDYGAKITGHDIGFCCHLLQQPGQPGATSRIGGVCSVTSEAHRGDIRRIELVVPSFRMAFQFVTGTERVLTCHRRHAKMYAKQYDVKLVEAPFDIPPIELQMQWHKYRDQDPALAWFRDLLQAEASKI